MYFHIGDRVRSDLHHDYGTVVAITNGMIGVDFDHWDRGHSIAGRLSGDHSHHGYWLYPQSLDLVDDLDNYNPPDFSLLI